MSRGLQAIYDAPQAALSFLVQQASVIETEVVSIQYPEVQYPTLIPVDTSAPDWAKSVTFFSLDRAGRAEWFHHAAKDIPLADVSRAKAEATIEMAAIGYRYDIEEIGQAMLMGVNLGSEKAEAARRAAEEFIDEIAIRGDTDKGLTGLINNASVTVVNAAFTGTGSSPTWADKTAAQILQDVNDALTGVYTESLQIEMADTILVPISELVRIATLQIPNTTMTALQWLKENNVYTMETGQPLMIRGVRGLETAGETGTGRMIVYRRDPRVVKLHLPMPHRFLSVYQTGPVQWDVPGILRVGGVEVRRPKAMRYVDNIINTVYE
jgi:hypothetical protein